MNKVLDNINKDEDEFVQTTMESKAADHLKEVKSARKMLAKSEKRIAELDKLTPDIMHTLVEFIIVHAPDKSSGHRKQEVEIVFRFKVVRTSIVLDRRDYDKRKKAA